MYIVYNACTCYMFVFVACILIYLLHVRGVVRPRNGLTALTFLPA